MNETEFFIRESNKIEGIIRDPTQEEIAEFNRFFKLRIITIEELERFVSVYQPGAKLRDEYNLNVRIGKYYPPFGGPEIRDKLQEILKMPLPTNMNDASYAYKRHIAYEKLHPFTDGNGRSGRMLWAWDMQDISLGFLHRFYYQTLENSK
jgi:hypothetical protein